MQQNLFIQSMVGYRNKHQIYVYACKSGTRANNELGAQKRTSRKNGCSKSHKLVSKDGGELYTKAGHRVR